MLNDSTHTELLIQEERPAGRKVVAALCAVLVTAIVFAGYTYLRRRHAQQVLGTAGQPQQASQNLPKGPAKANILVDDALLKGGQTIIGGAVRNISTEKLTGLTVGLELRRRKDSSVEQTWVPVEPSALEPTQEGRYVLRLHAQEYISVRLVALKGGSDSALLAYTASAGQKRPLEKTEPKVVTVPRPGAHGAEFLNSPDKPARVP